MTTDSSPQPVLAVFFDAVRDSYLIIITFIVMFTGVGQMSARAGLDVMQTGAMTALTLAAPARAGARRSRSILRLCWRTSGRIAC